LKSVRDGHLLDELSQDVASKVSLDLLRPAVLE